MLKIFCTKTQNMDEILLAHRRVKLEQAATVGVSPAFADKLGANFRQAHLQGQE
jgi:hypothetical protein